MSTLEGMGKRIRQRRKELRITQIGLAKALGLSEDSRSAISKWENGKEFPTTVLIPQLCNILRCDVGYLFGDYELPTRELTDISSEIGLSVEAINELRKTNKSTLFHSYLPVFSWLLSNGLMDIDILGAIVQLKSDAETIKECFQYWDNPGENMTLEESFARHSEYNNAKKDSDLMKFKADSAFRELIDRYYTHIVHQDKTDKRNNWEVIENGID